MSEETLTWDEVVATCSRTRGGREEMLEVQILPHRSITAVRATVVPTRMHEPGFYLRSPDYTPGWASWMARDEAFLLGEFRGLLDTGRVRRWP